MPLIFWGISQAFGLRSSIHYFNICLDALRIISNEIQQQVCIWPTLTPSLQCRYTWLVTAAQRIDCRQIIQYFHRCAPIWCSLWLTTVQAMCSMLYMSSKLNNRDRSTSSICSISCIFCIFCIFLDQHVLRGPDPSTGEGLHMQKKHYMQLRDLGVYWYVQFAYLILFAYFAC